MKDKDQEIYRDKKKDKEVDKIGKLKEKEKEKEKEKNSNSENYKDRNS
jgi:hypothetical protein